MFAEECYLSSLTYLLFPFPSCRDAIDAMVILMASFILFYWILSYSPLLLVSACRFNKWEEECEFAENGPPCQ